MRIDPLTPQSIGETLDWLLEPDSPGIHYLALRDLCGLSPDDHELLEARKNAHRTGPIAEILAAMDEAGFWSKPGAGYNPKYFSTVWSIITLAQLGANVSEDGRIHEACAYIVEHALAEEGQFTYNGAPSGTFDCLQGNLCWALLELGYDHPRLESAFDWMARTVTGEGMAGLEQRKAERRYYAYKCGPTFACGANNKLPCSWGAVKVMLAFGRLAEARRTPMIQRAIDAGISFFFSVDPATAAYPTTTGKPSGDWWKFGFPIFYVTDLLQLVEALTRLGYGKDARLANSVKLITDKQDVNGRWMLEYDYSGKIWSDFGKRKQPNKWVTLRALRVLNAVAGVTGN